MLEKFYDATYIDARTGNKAKGKELFNGRINRNHKKDSENLHKYRARKTAKGRRSIRTNAIPSNQEIRFFMRVKST